MTYFFIGFAIGAVTSGFIIYHEMKKAMALGFEELTEHAKKCIRLL